MTNCKNKKLIGPYLDGQLGDCPWLDEHLTECPECLAEFEALQRIAYIAARADYPPPESSYWKNFPTRVTARIAARQHSGFYARVREHILGNKLLLRLATPVAVIVIGLLFYKANSYLGGFAEKAFDKDTAIVNIVDEALSPESFPEPEAETAGLHLSESYPLLPESHAGSDIKPTASQSDRLPLGEQDRAFSTESIESAQTKPGFGIKDYAVDNLNLPVSHYRLKSDYGLNELVFSELNRLRSYRDYATYRLHTDQVIKYQILAGSNSSLAPLVSHRQAVEKYFAPRKSLVREIPENSRISTWGYAIGDNGYDPERQRHITLEFKLIREK